MKVCTNGKKKGREAFVPATVSEGGQAEENLESFVLKPLYTRKELQEFKERNSVGNVFRTTRQTVRSAEDLEKLFLYGRKRRKMRLAVGRSP